MTWTKITPAQYRRDGLRYASDVSDEEWLLIASFLPRARRLGRPFSGCATFSPMAVTRVGRSGML